MILTNISNKPVFNSRKNTYNSSRGPFILKRGPKRPIIPFTVVPKTIEPRVSGVPQGSMSSVTTTSNSTVQSSVTSTSTSTTTTSTSGGSSSIVTRLIRPVLDGMTNKAYHHSSPSTPSTSSSNTLNPVITPSTSTTIVTTMQVDPVTGVSFTVSTNTTPGFKKPHENSVDDFKPLVIPLPQPLVQIDYTNTNFGYYIDSLGKNRDCLFQHTYLNGQLGNKVVIYPFTSSSTVVINGRKVENENLGLVNNKPTNLVGQDKFQFLGSGELLERSKISPVSKSYLSQLNSTIKQRAVNKAFSEGHLVDKNLQTYPESVYWFTNDCLVVVVPNDNLLHRKFHKYL